MKKTYIFILIATVAVFGCSKKITPTKTEEAVKVESQQTDPHDKDPGTPTLVVGPTAEQLAAGQIVYVAKCGKCHDLPVTTDFTSARWIGLISWMAPKAKLSEDEKKNVLAYVQANAKQ